MEGDWGSVTMLVGAAEKGNCRRKRCFGSDSHGVLYRSNGNRRKMRVLERFQWGFRQCLKQCDRVVIDHRRGKDLSVGRVCVGLCCCYKGHVVSFSVVGLRF